MVRITLLILLTLHTIVTLVTLNDAGVRSVFPPFKDLFVYQIFSDLVVAAGIVFLLCYRQLRKKGRPITGLIITAIGVALSGSFALLVYLLIEKDLFDE